MLLPKHPAEAERVSLYESYFYCTCFAGPSQGVEAGNGAEEEKPAVHAGKRSTTSGSGIRASQQLASKRKNQRALATRWSPPTGAQHLALGPPQQSWANNLLPAAGSQQPATQTIRGRGNVHGCIGRARRTNSAK